MSNLAFRIGRFGTVGLASNVTLYLVFLALVAIGVVPVLATGIVYVAGTLLNYVLHRQITFADKRSANSKRRHGKDPFRFGVAYGAGLLVSLAGMTVMGPVFGPELAQIVVVFLSAATIFVILSLTGFGTGSKPH